MSYNGSGTFLINTAGQPVVSGTVISSTAFNALTADLATGLSTAITKDGQTTVTANIPMGTYKFTGLGAGTAATDSANLSQVQSTVTKLLASVSGADTITAVASPTLGAYAAGQMFYFVAAGTNTGAVTLNIDSLGAKAVTRDGSTALTAGDLRSGEVIVVVYDGTRFQVVSQVNSGGDATFANVSITSALNVGGVATFTGNPVLSGGTANGVLYVNSTKVAASGSALTFDGANILTLFRSTATEAQEPTVSFSNKTFATQNPGVVKSSNGGLALDIQSPSDATFQERSRIYMNGGTSSTVNFQFSSNNGSTYSDRMTLNSTGLGIGTSSPAVRLDVQTASAVGGITLTATTGTNGAAINCVNTGGSSYFGRNNSSGGAFGGAAYATVVYSGGAYPMSFYTNDTERARITSGGSFQVVATGSNSTFTDGGQISLKESGNSPYISWHQSTGARIGYLQMASGGNCSLWVEANQPLVFATNNTERARITAGGYSKFSNNGTYDSSSSVNHEFNQNVADWTLVTKNTNASPLSLLVKHSTDSNGTGNEFLYCEGGVTLRASIRSNGGLANYSANNVNLASDERLKKDISPLDSAWSKVKEMEVVNFRYKDCNEGDPLLYGVIAQQVQPIVPELVVVTREATETDPEYYGIREQPMYWLAIKALQEAMTKIEKLEAEVAALKGA